MGRSKRLEYEGSIHHVIHRGDNKETIFRDDNNKKYFIKILGDTKENLDFNLFAYVLMGNHYHLLIKRNKEPLSKIMHRINSHYSKYFNYIHGRIGHVFGERYKSIIVEDERYLLSLVRYIHQNPVRAGICEKPEDYHWSSDMEYRSNIQNLTDIDLVLNTISHNRLEANNHYRSFLREKETENYDNCKIIGSTIFKNSITQKPNKEEKKDLDEILIETGITNEDFCLIKAGSRKRDLTKYKKDYIENAIEHNYSITEISKNIKVSTSAVCQLLNRHLT